jgi:hypothetical protein
MTVVVTNIRAISKLRLYFLMAKTIKLITKDQYKEYKSKVNAYERNWRIKHKEEHTENSKKLLEAMKNKRKTVKDIWSPKKAPSKKKLTSKVKNKVGKGIQKARRNIVKTTMKKIVEPAIEIEPTKEANNINV